MSNLSFHSSKRAAATPVKSLPALKVKEEGNLIVVDGNGFKATFSKDEATLKSYVFDGKRNVAERAGSKLLACANRQRFWQLNSINVAAFGEKPVSRRLLNLLP